MEADGGPPVVGGHVPRAVQLDGGDLAVRRDGLGRLALADRELPDVKRNVYERAALGRRRVLPGSRQRLFRAPSRDQFPRLVR